MIELKGMRLIHDFYVVVSKQCLTENACVAGSPIQNLYTLTNVLFYYLFVLS